MDGDACVLLEYARDWLLEGGSVVFAQAVLVEVDLVGVPSLGWPHWTS